MRHIIEVTCIEFCPKVDLILMTTFVGDFFRGHCATNYISESEGGRGRYENRPLRSLLYVGKINIWCLDYLPLDDNACDVMWYLDKIFKPVLWKSQWMPYLSRSKTLLIARILLFVKFIFSLFDWALCNIRSPESAYILTRGKIPKPSFMSILVLVGSAFWCHNKITLWI